MFSSQQIDQFKEICSSFGVNLSDEMIDKFQDYTNLLLDWNQRIHLVSKGDAREDRIIRHVTDSLTIFKAIDIPERANILDLGSGAGFPAIPIKIVRDDVKMTLVESIHKKTLFLQKGIEVLKLNSAELFDGRAEKLADKRDYLGRFDLVTAKALGKLKETMPISMRFLRVGGLMVAYKGTEVVEEIKEINAMEGSRFKKTVRIHIQPFDLLRQLVLVEKVAPN
jgi:16S rRNA (guanine527-N7)-methyltransferase